MRDTAVLLTSELVTNAVQHAQAAAVLEVHLPGSCLQVRVVDEGALQAQSLPPLLPAPPRRVRSRAAARGRAGRPLGGDAPTGGTLAWFDLDLPAR